MELVYLDVSLSKVISLQHLSISNLGAVSTLLWHRAGLCANEEVFLKLSRTLTLNLLRSPGLEFKKLPFGKSSLFSEGLKPQLKWFYCFRSKHTPKLSAYRLRAHSTLYRHVRHSGCDLCRRCTCAWFITTHNRHMWRMQFVMGMWDEDWDRAECRPSRSPTFLRHFPQMFDRQH